MGSAVGQAQPVIQENWLPCNAQSCGSRRTPRLHVRLQREEDYY